MGSEKTFYIGVNNPSEIRRALLGCSKEIISVLKNYDKINSIRKEKAEKIINLYNTINEIKKLNKILQEKLPAENIRFKSSEKRVKKHSKRKIVKKTLINETPKEEKAASRSDSEIKKLEQELSEIENRLGKMGV